MKIQLCKLARWIIKHMLDFAQRAVRNKVVLIRVRLCILNVQISLFNAIFKRFRHGKQLKGTVTAPARLFNRPLKADQLLVQVEISFNLVNGVRERSGDIYPLLLRSIYFFLLTHDVALLRVVASFSFFFSFLYTSPSSASKQFIYYNFLITVPLFYKLSER